MSNAVNRLFSRLLVGGAALTVAAALVACGGGGGGSTAAALNSATPSDESVQAAGVVRSTGVVLSDFGAKSPATLLDAHRFLTQATFGPTPSAVTAIQSSTYGAWIDSQLATPTGISHQQLATERNAATGGKHQFFFGFWQKALTAPDQLRQRTAFALSQIFVVSFADQCGLSSAMGMASYYDMLTKQAFGSYRDLLQAVALHPMMGCYLSHLRNQKADPITGRVPDENFAREILQLFSIGLVQLNSDGTPKRDAQGREVETYSPSDVAELARVFTGFSWDCPDYPADNCFKYWGATSRPGYADPWTVPMRGYPKFHDSAAKVVLGKSVSAQTDPAATLKQALDIIASHPNVAPFISKQLIQRFVTSNPSKEYVARVAAKFISSGGNIGQTVKAVLLDDEARNPDFVTRSNFGKVKEPIVRFSALLRAYGAKSDSGYYLIGDTREAAFGLNQSPLFAPSVFNFYRPGYTLPGSATAAAGMVAPELQIADETSMAGYVGFASTSLWAGVGRNGYNGTAARADIQFPFTIDPANDTLKLAGSPSALIDDINRKLFGGTMSVDLKNDISAAMNSIEYRAQVNPTPAQIESTFKARIWSALALAVASPEYIVQK
jgi:uncharacterized protein (DUF1800 family)